ncbi:MAG TPA: hypothetical protein VKX28_18670 [Xanthobacteraceae bacterium]|nr:hypothetical protein [Xanthobacteraceae bacterium]
MAVVLGVACGVAASADPRASGTGALAAPATQHEPLPPPIVFFVAKGDANACGPGCSEWIAAEGTIDIGADARLRLLLKKLGARKLPIYFESPGGAIPAGLAIGRIMRQHGLTAGVGRTVPVGCDPKAVYAAACDKLKRSGRELLADLDTSSAICNSACVFSLVGATVREVGPGAKLGIHSASVTFSLRRVDAKGHVVATTPTHVAAAVERRALAGNYDRIAAYMHEMGISPTLLEAARKIPSSSVRYLSRDEVVAFGIDPRESIEGLWLFLDQPSGAVAVKVMQWREPAAGTFRRAILRMSCVGADTVRFQFAREVGADKASLPGRFRVKAGPIDRSLGWPVMTKATSDWLPLQVRAADLPISVLGEPTLVIEQVIEQATPPSTLPEAAAINPSAATEVTVQNIGSGLSTLAHRCAAPPAPHQSSAIEHI